MATPEPARSRAARLLFAILLLAVTALAQSAPRIGLVTMEPGPEYWSRFGHNALLVEDAERATLYNYGYFDFDQPGFLTRFLQGRMLYQLVALPLERDLAGYAAEGRGVSLQWLALSPAASTELAAFLAHNARPENAEYRYDYFTDNCSTRVRDALDRALGGELSRQLRGRSHGYTYRSEARRLAASLPWMYFGIHLGLGPFTDRPLSLWEEGFIPMRLREAIAEARTAGGEPLVRETRELLPHRLAPSAAEPPAWRSGFVLVGIALALGFTWLLTPRAGTLRRRAGAVMLIALWVLFGLGGLGLLALWGFTDHAAAWENENALLFNPLCLLLLAAIPALWRDRPIRRWLQRVALAVALCGGLALFLKFLPFRIQDNGDWIALLLPLHTALALRLAQRGASDPAHPRRDNR